MKKLGMGMGRVAALILCVAAAVGCGDNGIVPEGKPSLLLSTDTVAVDEGGTATFTITLSEAIDIDGAVNIAVADGGVATVSPAVVTFSAGDVGPKTITVTGVQDDDLADDTSQIVISAANIAAATLTVNVNDDDAQGLAVSSSTLMMTEGTSSTVTVALAFAPAADTTVTVASADTTRLGATPATLTFTAANFSTPQTVTLAAANDTDAVNNTVNVTVSTAGVTDSTIAVTINDDDVQNLIANPTSLALTEGGTAGTFQVTLTQMPTSNVVINVASSDTGAATVQPATLTFTPADYNMGAAHVVTVTTVQDADTANETLAVNLTGALTGSVPVTITDDDMQRIVATPTAVSVAEGADQTVNVHLAFNPGQQVTVTVISADSNIATVSPTTLTFDATNFGTDQPVVVHGVTDVDLTTETTNLSLSSSVAPTITVAVTVTESSVQDIQLAYSGAPGALSMAESTTTTTSTATVAVRLAFMPAAATTIAISSNNPDLTVSTTMLTFQPADYNVPQNVVFTAVDEADLVNETATVTFEVAGGPSRTITVNIQDTDVQGFNFVPGVLPTIAEGSSTTFQINLNFAPAAPVSVTIASDNENVLVNGGATTSITVGTNNVGQSVTVSVAQDSDARDESATLSVTATGVPTRTIAVTGDDDETMSFVVTPITANVDGQRVTVNEEGTDGFFDVSLSAQPTGPVTISIIPSQTNTVTVRSATTSFAATTSLTFDSTNFATPQRVFVHGLSDPNLVDEIFTVSVAGPPELGAPAASVWVRKVEDDIEALVTTPAANGTVVITEGSTTGEIKVRLRYQPVMSTQVTVTPSTGLQVQLDGGAIGAPVNLLFTTTNWEVDQTVSIITPSDVDQVDDADGYVDVTSPTLASVRINIDLVDEDDQAIVLSPTSLSLAEASTPTFTGTFDVSLAYQPTAATETITITVPPDGIGHVELCTSVLTHGPGPGLVCSNSLTLGFSETAGIGGWNVPQTVTVRTIDDADVISEVVTLGLASSIPATPARTFVVTITDDDTQNIQFTPASVNITEEGTGSGSAAVSASFAINLTKDPTTPLDVSVTSGDTGAVTAAPASLTFTSPGGSNPYTTTQNITVTAVTDDDVRDETVTVTLASPGRADPRTVTVVVADNDQQSITKSGVLNITEGAAGAPLLVRLAQQPTNPVTVHITSNVTAPASRAADQGVLLATGSGTPAATLDLTFDATTWNVDQTVTVSAPEDADLDHFSGALTLAVTSAQTGRELAATLTHVFEVADNDSQAITVALSPLVLVNSAQERGPYVQFNVVLGARPRLGASDTVTLSAQNNVRFVATDTNTSTLSFTEANWNVPQTVKWYVADLNNLVAATSAITLTIVESSDPDASFVVTPRPNVVAMHATRALDRSQTVVDSEDYTDFNGATNFTQRSNVAWAPDGTAEGRVAFTSRSAASGGDVSLGFTQRNLASAASSASFATGGVEPTTEIVLYNADGSGSWDVFSSSTSGIVFARMSLTGASLLAPVAVAPATDNAKDFSVARNGAVYGVVYRRDIDGRRNLYFRSVSIATGAASTEIQSTTPTTNDHLHPTLHTVGGTYGPSSIAAPYIVVYSELSTNKLVRLTTAGAPVASVTFGSEFPGQNFSHSVFLPVGSPYGSYTGGVGTLWATNVQSTGPGLGDNSVYIYAIRVNSTGQVAQAIQSFQVTTQQLAPFSPPVIAFNGRPDNVRGDFAVAYDSSLNGDNRVGVALFNLNGGVVSRDFRLTSAADAGLFPSIAWAEDRWVLRYQTDAGAPGIRVRTGSFDGSATPPAIAPSSTMPTSLRTAGMAK